MNNWTILYVSNHLGDYPHIDQLYKTNPEAQILLVDQTNSLPKEIAWRNSDNIIRKWIQKHYSKITYNNIAILEYDVYCNQRLPNFFITNEFYARTVNYHSINSKWRWFDTQRIGGAKPLIDCGYKEYLIGFAPFGIIMTGRYAISQLINSKYDNIYQYDIISEVRVGTILNSCGIKFQPYEMPNVLVNLPESHIFDFSQQSIFHPVKHKIKEQ